mmetsp:Transcript_4700/g.12119  ORF Transcript_4700/g.12119 Transcript_4700/m.12119 type:complete len:287 (-) Transcript_4700:72-932(-)
MTAAGLAAGSSPDESEQWQLGPEPAAARRTPAAHRNTAAAAAEWRPEQRWPGTPAAPGRRIPEHGAPVRWPGCTSLAGQGRPQSEQPLLPEGSTRRHPAAAARRTRQPGPRRCPAAPAGSRTGQTGRRRQWTGLRRRPVAVELGGAVALRRRLAVWPAAAGSPGAAGPAGRNPTAGRRIAAAPAGRTARMPAAGCRSQPAGRSLAGWRAHAAPVGHNPAGWQAAWAWGPAWRPAAGRPVAASWAAARAAPGAWLAGHSRCRRRGRLPQERRGGAGGGGAPPPPLPR